MQVKPRPRPCILEQASVWPQIKPMNCLGVVLNLFKRWTAILISLSFIASTALALSDDLQSLILDGNIYGHSDDKDFNSDSNNKVAVVSKGTEAKVLETKPLRNGAYAVQIEVTKAGSSKNRDSAHVGEKVWIYYSKKSPWIKFEDKNGKEIADPEKDLTGKAQRDGESLRATPPAHAAAEKPEVVAKKELVPDEPAERRISSPPQKEADPNLERESPAARRKNTEGKHCATCGDNDAHPNIAAKNFKELKAVPEAVPGAVKKQVLPKTPHVATKWDSDPMVSKYSNSAAVKSMINYGMNHKAGETEHRCYHFVKDALTKSHPPILSSRPPSIPAKNAMFELKQEGMINMMDDPRYKDLIKDPGDAPKGAILVYTNKGLGHIEIKTGDGSSGGYVSDFYNKDSILGNPLGGLASRNYTLSGVFIKEMP